MHKITTRSKEGFLECTSCHKIADMGQKIWSKKINCPTKIYREGIQFYDFFIEWKEIDYIEVSQTYLWGLGPTLIYCYDKEHHLLGGGSISRIGALFGLDLAVIDKLISPKVKLLGAKKQFISLLKALKIDKKLLDNQPEKKKLVFRRNLKDPIYLLYHILMFGAVPFLLIFGLVPTFFYLGFMIIIGIIHGYRKGKVYRPSKNFLI